MIRLLALLFPLCGPAFAQDGCPTATDLDHGIVLTRESGATDTFAGDAGLMAAISLGADGSVFSEQFLAQGYLPVSDTLGGSVALYDWGPDDTLPPPEPLAGWTRPVTFTSPEQSVTSDATVHVGAPFDATVGGCRYDALPVTLWLGDGRYDLTYLTALGFAYESYAPQDYVVSIAALP